MRAGHVYRHRHCLDMDLYVERVQYRGPSYIVTKVKYWSRDGKYFYAGGTETIRIQRNHLANWRDVGAI
jgi:hypothetical protein